MNLNELFLQYKSKPSQHNLTEVLKSSQILIYGIVIKITNHDQDSEDLTQEVLIKVIQNINVLPKDTNFGGWLNRTSLNTAINFYHLKQRLKTIENQVIEKSPDKESNEETIAIIYQHLSLLEEIEESLILNKYIHQMTFAQMSIHYQLPKSTIESKIKIILNKLKVSIEKAGFAGVALGLASSLEQLKATEVSINLLPKIQEFFPSNYPSSSVWREIEASFYKKTFTNIIKNKAILSTVSVLFVLVVSYITFTYNNTSPELKLLTNKSELHSSLLSKKYEYVNKDLKSISKTKNDTIDDSLNNNNSKNITPNNLYTNLSKDESSENDKNLLSHTVTKGFYEIVIINGENNELLKDYEVEISFSQPLNVIYDDNDPNSQIYKIDKYKTDKNGKVYISILNIRDTYLQIFTKDFAVHCAELNFKWRLKTYQAKLYKGCRLEVVEFNQTEKPLKNFKMRFNASKNDNFYHGFAPLRFDENKGVYLTSNLPIGKHQFYFQAEDYQDSSIFTAKFEVAECNLIKIKMLLPKKLYFDLEKQEKPDHIIILPWKKGSLILKQNKERSKAFKNQNNLYEFDLFDNSTECIIACVNRQIPQIINLTPEKNTFKIPYIEDFQGKLKIKNVNGKPIVGAKINYLIGYVKMSATSDEDGLAILNGLSDSMEIDLEIHANGYLYSNEQWTYNSKDSCIKNIVLNETNNENNNKLIIGGKIIKDGKFVEAAKVFLIQNKKGSKNKWVFSDSSGSFIFKNIELEENQSFKLLAYHSELGVAIYDNIKLEKEMKSFELNLTYEKSLAIKLVDSEGKSLPNKKITLSLQGVFFDYEDLYWPLIFEIETNENGECCFNNLLHGLYDITLDDSKLKLKNDKVIIPNGNIVLKVEQKSLKQVNIKVTDGIDYKGMLKVESNRWDSTLKGPIIGNDGNIYIDIEKVKQELFSFEIPGHAILRMGPYAGLEDLPDVFNLEFKKGESVKITVLDELNDTPVSFVPVSIYYENKNLISLPTNENGEVFLFHINDERTVKVTAKGYMPYQNDFDFSKSKEYIVRLQKGGGLKGTITINNDLLRAEAILTPNYDITNVSSEYTFEFFNLKPGEYELKILKYFKNGNRQNMKAPFKIKIENNKVFEINLDDQLKNETILDISVFTGNSLVKGIGVIDIRNRNDQEVYSANIYNGKHLVQRILPGEYLLSYSDAQGQSADKIINIINHQNNNTDLILPSSILHLVVKNEFGEIIKAPVVRLFVGEKYGSFYSYLLASDHLGRFNLSPNQSYFILIEADYILNYQPFLLGPIKQEEGQERVQEVLLTKGKKLSNIQIIDSFGKPIENISFMVTNRDGAYIQKKKGMGSREHLYSDKNGFLPENGWPNDDFNLIVFKDGYEFKELKISSNIASDKIIQIKLNAASSIEYNLSQSLNAPISIGILNSNEELIERPVPYTLFDDKIFGVYFENITQGSVKFTGLAAGTYYIGIYLNGSTKLISKHGPYKIEEGENIKVHSTFQEN